MFHCYYIVIIDSEISIIKYYVYNFFMLYKHVDNQHTCSHSHIYNSHVNK